MVKLLLVLTSMFLLSGCGVQSIPKSKNKVDASVAEVTNQYKRRADLIPSLVKVVKSYASHEKSTLQAVVEARSKATQITVDPANLSPAKLKQFQQAQGQLSSALGKLMMLREAYPNLKANQNFRDLQVQLEGTENRITIARQRLIQSIENFNNQVSVPPSSWTNSLLYNHSKMAQWTVDDPASVEKVPEIDL